MRRVLVGAPLLLLGLLAVPAGAGDGAGVGAAAAPVPRLPAGLALELGPDGRTVRTDSPLHALTRRTRGDAGAITRAVAAAVAAAAPSAPTPLLSVPGEGDGAFELQPVMGAFGTSGGDLDGDGLADVVAFVQPDGAPVLQARRGTDGALLWSRPLDVESALAFPTGEDLTGDGAHDLLVDGVTAVGSVEDRPDGYRSRVTLEQTYGVVDGRTGELVWSRTVSGSIEESYSGAEDPVGVAGTWQSEVVLRDVVLPLLAGDLDEDGAGDLVLDTVDLTLTESGTGAGLLLAGAGRYTAALRASTVAEAVDGGTGTSRAVRTAAPGPALALLTPLGPALDGSGADLLWSTEAAPDVDLVCAVAADVRHCTDEGDPPTTTVELVDGRSAQALWTAVLDEVGAFARPLEDADRDGVRDVAVVLFDQDVTTVLSGASGRELWRTEPASGFLLGVEDGVALLVDVEGRSGQGGTPTEPAPFVVELRVERRDAATGAVLREDAHELPELPAAMVVGLFAGFELAADGDGDRVRDLVMSASASSYDQDGDGEVRSLLRAESATDGRPLLHETSDDVRLLSVFGDLDGDGLTDVLRDVVGGGDVFAATEATALRLVDGAQLWRFSGGFFDVPLPAGDQDGVPGVELVRGGHDEQRSWVESLRGADLGPRWTTRTAPTGPPLPSTG